MFKFLALTLFFTAPCALAFQSTRHYSVATETSHLNLTSNQHWDSEASSDFVVYQRPLEWEGEWLRGDKIFDLSIGSISSKEFLTYQRLKLIEPLSENVEFRFHWIEDRDFEQDRRQAVLELKFSLTDQLAVSIFGQPSLYKDEDDVGASLFWKPTQTWELQVSGAFGDFQRNQRNEESDRWDKAPRGWTLSSTYLPDDSDDFFTVEAHWEPESRRSNRGLPLWEATSHSFYTSGVKDKIGWRALYDFAYVSDYTLNTVAWRERSLNQIEYRIDAGEYRLRPALNVFYRDNRSNAEQETYREVLPAFWWDLPVHEHPWGKHRLSLGYDVTVFEKQTAMDEDVSLEHRLNIKTDMQFSKAGQLALIFTFDVDRFGSGQTWEGGAGQFRLEF